MISAFIKIFFKRKPKITIVKIGEYYYIRKRDGLYYRYLTNNEREIYWWSEGYKEHARYKTLESVEKRWKSSNLDSQDDDEDDGTNVVKILK